MNKFTKPLQEVNYRIGILYELSLQSNYRLTESVNNLKVSVNNMVTTENKLQFIVAKQDAIDCIYPKIAAL